MVSQTIASLPFLRWTSDSVKNNVPRSLNAWFEVFIRDLPLVAMAARVVVNHCEAFKLKGMPTNAPSLEDEINLLRDTKIGLRPSGNPGDVHAFYRV